MTNSISLTDGPDTDTVQSSFPGRVREEERPKVGLGLPTTDLNSCRHDSGLRSVDPDPDGPQDE